MSGFKNAVRRALRLPGVPEARHVAERAVAPYLRADLTSLHQTILEHNHRLRYTEDRVNEAADAVADVQRHMPAVLNAITSTNGTARLLRRELDAVRDENGRLRSELEALAASVWKVEAGAESADSLHQRLTDETASIRAEMRPHVDTIAWLLRRIETVRAEVLHELRYGRGTAGGDSPTTEIVNPSALVAADEGVRLNLGCGHLPLESYVNIDIRKLPGVDVVAPVDDLPLEPGSVAEIFSAHTLEHFPEEQLKRSLLPYWHGLLRPSGRFRAVVPDVGAMIEQYQRGEITFDALREVVYGGQEYEGDFHFTAFTPDSLGALLEDAGFEKASVIEQGRPNGECLEFEIEAYRPA